MSPIKIGGTERVYSLGHETKQYGGKNREIEKEWRTEKRKGKRKKKGSQTRTANKYENEGTSRISVGRKGGQ